jgi:hypothetical protein
LREELKMKYYEVIFEEEVIAVYNDYEKALAYEMGLIRCIEIIEKYQSIKDKFVSKICKKTKIEERHE